VNPREERLNRLASLRTLQHDAAIAHLRSANHVLYAAAEACEREANAVPAARSAMRDALQSSNQKDWLLSRADATWSGISMGLCRQQQVAAERVVKDAATREAEARRESKQMKTAVDTLRREQQEAATRTEQKTLDEVALRMLRHTPEHAIPMRRIP
jgi:hypothetical protein